MDDGYVIPALNEGWSFAGAKPMEWASGLVAAILVKEFFISNLGRSMPLFIMTFVCVPMLLATVRKMYPDEERGVRNHLMSLMGMAPPDIPPPAALQPVYSGSPMREMDKTKEFVALGLNLVTDSEIVNAEEEFMQSMH